jgi:penicillin amidase
LNLSRQVYRLLLGRRLPRTRGTLTVSPISASLWIDRDKWGIPHISAANELDAWFGLGFCQGQDRSFQLEILLRVMRGTLAQLVGENGIGIDRLSRRVGFHRTSPAQLAVLAPEVRAQMEAYADGVNAGATIGQHRRPHEFVLLRARPTLWSAVDVVAGLKLQGFVLSSNWDIELARLKILLADGPQALADLDPAYPDWLPVKSSTGEDAEQALDQLADDLKLFTSVMRTGGASNNWVVAGSRTASGRPIVANDPHLPPTLPSPWYLAHLRTPEWAAAGASFVGCPCIPAGHNGFASWGITASFTDNTDLYIEQVGPDGKTVRQGNSFVPCAVHREIIEIRRASSIVEEVLVTPRGPIIGPALEDTAEAISLRAVWLDPLPIQGLLRIHRARSFEEARRVFVEWPTLPLNLVYADETGQTGWQSVGQAPRRRLGRGALPMPGWDVDSSWDGELIPFDQMPHQANPTLGCIATANQKPSLNGECPYLGVDWLEGYRADTANDALKRRTDWDGAATMALQMNQHNLHWREVREFVIGIPADEPASAMALRLLKEWDGCMTAESPAGALYALLMAEMSQRIARARAPKSFAWALGRGQGLLMPHGFLAVRWMGHLASLFRQQPAGWFARSWSAESADALRSVIRHLEQNHGPEPTDWAWGKIRQLTVRHMLDRRPPLDRIYDLGPIPCGGDANTLNQAAPPPLDPTGNPAFIASLRMVVEIGDWDNARFVLPGGQSGNPFSPHYADQFPLWRGGEAVTIAWSEVAIQRGTRQSLELKPKS